MATFPMGSQAPFILADSIIQERTIIQQHYEMIRSLRVRVAANERLYGISPPRSIRPSMTDACKRHGPCATG
jgi:hypothetical protein